MNKPLTVILLALVLGFFNLKNAFSQELTQKLVLFKNSPTAIHFQSSLVNDLIKAKEGEKISLKASENLTFSGTVIQNVKWNEEAQTVAIALEQFPANTRLVINKISRDGKIIYKGQILNINSPEAYQLTSFSDTEFVFAKVSTQNIVTE